MTSPMKISTLSAAAAIVALATLGAAPAVRAQATQLTPQAQRISDAAITVDQKAYEGLQARIKGLNDKGRPVRDYHLSKAQCWLDVSFHEYTRNDRGPFPQAALTESEKLVVAMEQGAQPLPMATPLVGEAVAIRPDLWAAAKALQGHAGWRCAQQKTACAEVELVHAGNEQAQQQWRHAKPYVQIAEDLLGEARAQAEACVPPPPPPAPPPVVPVPVVKAAPPVAVQEVKLAAQVVFNFDRHTAQDIRPWSTLQLEQLVAQVRDQKLQVQSIHLVGHADRLNGTGHTDYNQQLSEKRVATVRAILVKLGIDARLIDTAARGDQQQIQGCEARFSRKAELEECLLPNRRVEVSITARKP